jgi:hypothetical protein
MTRTRLAVGSALVVAAAYILTAMLSGHLNPLTRRPVLDGFAPPAPYRWVKPPPALAPSNLKPASGRFTVQLDPQAGSEPMVLTTTDAQVSLVLARGTIPPRPGFSRAAVTVTPLAPRQTAVSKTFSIAGNVVRIHAAYAPGGPPVDTVRAGGQLVLFYPPALDNLHHDHAILYSRDGVGWQELLSQDASAQQQVLATITRLGQFAVGEKATGTAAAFPIGKVIYYALIIGAVVLFAVGIITSELRRRRTKSQKRRPRAKRR